MWTTDESGALTPNQSFMISDLDDTKAGYTITITAAVAEGVPNAPGDRTFTAKTRVTVTARPVSVALTRPDTLFKVNSGSLTIACAHPEPEDDEGNSLPVDGALHCTVPF